MRALLSKTSLLLVAFLWAGCAADSTESGDTAAMSEEESARMLELADDQARRLFSAHPEYASQIGVPEAFVGERYTDRFSDLSAAGIQSNRDLNARFLEELLDIDRSLLEGTAATTYDFLLTTYRIGERLDPLVGGAYMNYTGFAQPYTLNQLDGPHIDFPSSLQNDHPLNTEQDVEDYLTRMELLASELRNASDLVLSDAERGIVLPDFALQSTIGVLRSFTEMSPAENPLATSLGSRLEEGEAFSEEQVEAWVERSVAILLDEIYPAYAHAAETLEGLLPDAVHDAGIWRIPNGDAYYELALESYGGSGRTAEELHQIGLQEVARISSQMDAIFREIGMTEGTVGERFVSMVEDEQYLYPNTDAGREELIADLNAQVAELQPRLSQYFGTVPPQPVEVKRIPEYEEDSAPGGYYTQPALDGSRPGTYWINLKNTGDWPRFTLKPLTYHEANPGHHFQISVAMQVEDMPLIRNVIWYSQYGEGWALYAEKVAEEMGMFDGDPHGQLGRLQSELFRAARIVVDTGIHFKRWSREEAIAYMREVTGDTEASVTREIERYSVWPGQATSYKLGMLKLEELRARVEAELGDAFDVRAFHDAVLLSGTLPLPVLEERIDRFIEENRPNR